VLYELIIPWNFQNPSFVKERKAELRQSRAIRKSRVFDETSKLSSANLEKKWSFVAAVKAGDGFPKDSLSLPTALVHILSYLTS